MARTAKTFVGFGFGPIQSGLFLLEARLSGSFSRLVVAEVAPALVAAVRAGGNRYTVNVARKNRVDRVTVEGVEAYNPDEPAGRRRLVDAVAESDEMATALPSVKFYDAPGPAGVAGILADGLARRPQPLPAIIYAAENHNRAAELLAEAVNRHAKPGSLAHVQTLNTVIGKMSGVIDDPETVRRLRLATIVPGGSRAVLVEEFNRIFISRIAVPVRRGIEVFVEKDGLLPFEEAKLYGHNAIHALIGYLADLKGYRAISEAGGNPSIMTVARNAFIGESGGALIARHKSLDEELFTPAGYRAYADDLLERMVCPFLNDLVRRVTRDHARKLGYSDRLFGTMRLALAAGIQPVNLALGAAAAVLSMIRRRGELDPPPPALPVSPAELTRPALQRLLSGIWGRESGPHAPALIELTWDALSALRLRPS